MTDHDCKCQQPKPPPVPGSTAHRLAQFFLKMDDPPKGIAEAKQHMAEAIQLGIDYEVGKARLEVVERLKARAAISERYRKALEQIVKGCLPPEMNPDCEITLARDIARDALKE